MSVNKFRFLILMAVLQCLPVTGFGRERPERFAQDLGGNLLCRGSNNVDPRGRCPLRPVTAVTTSQPKPATEVISEPLSGEIPQPMLDSERTPSAFSIKE